MTNRIRVLLLTMLVFAFAIAGVFVGRAFFMPRPSAEKALHNLLHHELDLDAGQRQKIEALEQHFATRRHALELELKTDNARIAEAIETEHGYGPKVAAAVDQSHRAMGELQNATLQHLFAMRDVLRPDQAAKFDKAVTRALTANDR